MAENFVEMELREIQIVEDFTTSQIIVLAEKYGDRAFPIFIGLHEAMAMDLAVRGETTPRPLTHDLVLNTVDGAGATLVRVLIVKLEHETFFGALELKTASGELTRIDARPSDAIVISAKRQAPIFVEEKVLREVQRKTELGATDDEEEDEDDDQSQGY
jgi:uncharacterized protein